MIHEQAIVAWRREAPWSANAMVEQDLVISRALVALFEQPLLAERLAFRGGTALYKLYLRPPARYSEDIDLVQVQPGPIGETFDLVRGVLDPWLGTPQRQLKEGRVNLVYRFVSEDSPPQRMRLKVEMNSREHFSVMGLVNRPFAVDNAWFRGEASITTYALEELLGTKLRALYQRRKGRDLFDLWLALTAGGADPNAVLTCFRRYMEDSDSVPTRAVFEENLFEKASRQDFRGDMDALLRPSVSWSFDEALAVVLETLIARLPGAPWKRAGADAGR